MQAALFASTAQEAAQGLSDLMADFEANQIDISDYLDGFTSIAELVSSLSDTVMENGDAWAESGSMTEESISAMQAPKLPLPTAAQWWSSIKTASIPCNDDLRLPANGIG